MDFLLHIFNLFWSLHSFPSIWKTSSIIHIHKMGKPLDSSASFRPISLTMYVSKLFEHIILSRLLFFLESNPMLSPCLLPSAAHFTLTIWPFSPPAPLFLFCIKLFFGPFSLIFHPNGFLFQALPISPNWNASIERPVAPSPAASRPPLSHFFSPRLFCLPYELP